MLIDTWLIKPTALKDATSHPLEPIASLNLVINASKKQLIIGVGSVARKDKEP